jgi:hypothetical protein
VRRRARSSVGRGAATGCHTEDVYNPVDPVTVGDRLRAAGFGSVEVPTNPYGWAAHAVRLTRPGTTDPGSTVIKCA